jgi:hypothetical protein
MAGSSPRSIARRMVVGWTPATRAAAPVDKGPPLAILGGGSTCCIDCNHIDHPGQIASIDIDSAACRSCLASTLTISASRTNGSWRTSCSRPGPSYPPKCRRAPDQREATVTGCEASPSSGRALAAQHPARTRCRHSLPASTGCDDAEGRNTRSRGLRRVRWRVPAVRTTSPHLPQRRIRAPVRRVPLNP